LEIKLNIKTIVTTLLFSILIAIIGCSKLDENKQLLALDEKMKSGQYELVINEGEKFVKTYPDSFKGWNILGWGYLKSDQLKKAENCFEKSITINGEWDNSYVGKGVLYRKLGLLDKARQNYKKAISLVPDNAEAFTSLLVIELMEGNDQKAVEYGEKAWSLRKDFASIPANLSVAYHYSGDLEKRDQFYNHAKRLNYHNLKGLRELFEGKTTIR
jgi:tetratricopeptide (TPR) repeat protein